LKFDNLFAKLTLPGANENGFVNVTEAVIAFYLAVLVSSGDSIVSAKWKQ